MKVSSIIVWVATAVGPCLAYGPPSNNNNTADTAISPSVSAAAAAAANLHIIKLKSKANTGNNQTITAGEFYTIYRTPFCSSDPLTWLMASKGGFEPSSFIRQHFALYRMNQLQKSGATIQTLAGEDVPHMDTVHIGKGFSAVVGAFDPLFTQYLHQLDAIDYVEPNQIYRVQASPPVHQKKVITTSTSSWGISRITQRDHADLTRRLAQESVTGAGIHVYIFDTGINVDHPELKGRATHMANFIDYEGDNDSSGHGTHVAGIIGGVTMGVAPEAYVHSVKILDSKGDGTTVALIRAIEMVSAMAEKGKAIINMSLSGPPSKSIDDALASAALDHQIPIFVAAGNTGDDACQYTPAANPAVFAVGASDRQDSIALFSAFGECVRLYAPGVDITSSWLGAEVHSLDGTSMANPHVVGIAALLLSQRTFDSVEELYKEITAMATKGVLRLSHDNQQVYHHDLLAYTGVY